MTRRVKITIVVVLVVLLILGGSAGVFFGVMYPIKYKDVISKYCNEYKLSPSLVASLINVESGYDSKAVSAAGARGLMQVMPATASEIADKLNENYDIEKLMQVDCNIKYGCYYLRYLLDMYNDTTLALAAYNAGYNNVNAWLNDDRYSSGGKLHTIPFAETCKYVQRIQSGIKIYNIYF